MRSVSLRLADLERNPLIPIGFEGENEYTVVNIDCKKIFDEHPTAIPTLAVTPPEGDSYPAVVVRDGDIVSWTVCDSDLVYSGTGKIQFAFAIGESIIGKTYTARTRIFESINPSGEVPTPVENWLTEAGTVLGELQQAVPDGGTTGQVLAKKSNADRDTEWVDQTGGGGGTSNYNSLTNKPQIAGVTLNGNKTLHDLGAASEEAVNAKYTKPSGGIPGTDLADGVIPDPTSIIDDTAGDGDTNKVWSADKSHELLTEINSKQDAPSAAGTAGQVLGLDNNLAPKWVDQTGGGGSIDPQDIADAVDAWCDENITNPSNPPLDRSLLSAASAAPADIVGALSNMKPARYTRAITPFTQGYVDTSTGAIDPSGTTMAHSDVYEMEEGDSVTFTRANSKIAAASYYIIYDDDGVYVSWGQTNNGQTTTFARRGKFLVFVVQNGTQSIEDIIAAGEASFTATLSEKSKYVEHINYQQSLIDEVFDSSHWFKESVVNVTVNSGGYINASGEIASLNKYYYSDMISVAPNERYRIRTTNIGTAAYFWCMYKDGVKVQISNSGTGSSNVIDHEFHVTIPFGVNQLRVGWYNSSSNVEVFKRNSISVSENDKSLSILFVGNSLTQDGVSYLPYMLKNYFPEINFKLYLWYNSGYTLAEQYTKFSQNGKADTFSVAENVEAWTNYNDAKTMASVLSTYKFNIVCMQEYFNHKASYVDADLADFNNCLDYIVANYTGGNSLEFVTLFPAPKRSIAADVFAVTETGNGLMLQKTIAQDMIANGIAVYRALSTDLDQLGDEGHLSTDGIHTQEGVPCLLQTYTTICWILDKLGISKSVYGCPFRMTTAIFNTLNVPGANVGTGVITGTDAQNLLAQEVAIKAYKEGKRFVIDNLIPE